MNNSSSNNSSDGGGGGGGNYVPILPVPAKIGFYILYTFIAISGTSGNSMVVYVIGIKHRAERSCDVHIISLAMADLLSSIFIPLVTIHDIFTDYDSWYLFGEVGCKLLGPMNHLTILVSSLMLVTISLNRIHVIYSSTAVTRGYRRSIIEVMFVWIVSCIFISPYMYYMRVLVTPGGDYCIDVWELKAKFIYYAVLQSVSCFLAVITMVVVYTLSAVRIYQHTLPGSENNKKAECRRMKQNKNITKMFGRIVLVFFTLTTPNSIFFFVQAYIGTFREDLFFKEYKKFFYISQVLYAVSALNCCVNPIIYARMHKNMRMSFRKRVSWLFNRTNTTNSSSSRRDFAMRQRTQTSFTNACVTDD